MKWVEISISTTTGAVEATANVLYDAGVTGVVIEDVRDLEMLKNSEEAWDDLDEELADRYIEGALVKGYLPETPGVMEQVDLIRKAVDYLPRYGLDIGVGQVSTSVVDERDWEKEWKKYLKPIKPGNRIVIKPTWESYDASEEELLIHMDPGMAFGTGAHETTRLCVQELEKHVRTGMTVYDIGCGSGVLTIAAAALGADKVVGIDLDPQAVRVARENVTLNRKNDVVRIRQGNLMDVLTEKADLLISNIIAEIILKMCADILKYVKPGGLWISSGIILDKQAEVEEAIRHKGLQILETRNMGEWVSIVARLPLER